MRLTLRPVVAADWTWIQVWFRDPELDRRLGPMDEEWLRYVLQERPDAAELVAEADGGIPVGLIGLDWSGPAGVTAVTDVAVAPERRRWGIGRRVLRAAMDWPDLPATTTWTAVVDPQNPGAGEFLSACGWSCDGPDGLMIRWSQTVG